MKNFYLNNNELIFQKEESKWLLWKRVQYVLQIIVMPL
ncbi:Uncharacterised protein [Serratia fonticola]|nr:Uncharacterised protein [Serratia fonticola]